MIKKLIQSHPDDWLDDFQRRVHELVTLHSNAQAYALIDCAFSERCYATLKQQSNILQWRSLFDLSSNPNEKLAVVSPTLIPLHSNTANAWRSVMRQTNGMPMLSVIVTPESLNTLAHRLKVWCVVDADGENYCFRFADTRRLPDITVILTPQQHAQFFGPAHAWIYRDRTARWINLNLPTAAQPPAEEIHLSSDQCAHLIGASEADEIMADLNFNEPALMQALPPAHAHDALCKALSHANQGSIKKQDVLSWCSLWLRKPDLDKSRQVTQWLGEHQIGKLSYEDLVLAVMSLTLHA